jgi:hypothetical protein
METVSKERKGKAIMCFKNNLSFLLKKLGGPVAQDTGEMLSEHNPPPKVGL